MQALRRFAVVWLFAASIACATPYASAAGAADGLANVKKAGFIRIGVKTTLPGIGYANPANAGRLEGFEIDIAHWIAKSILGDPAKVRFVPIATADSIPMLRSGKIDLALATMTITSDRLKQIDFSDVYFKAGQALLVKAGSPIHSYRDLGGKNVCTVRHSTSEVAVRRVAPASRAILKHTYDECYDALKRAAVDAMTTDNVILLGFWQRDEKHFTLRSDTFTAEPYGVGIAKGSDALRVAVNAAIKAHRRSLEYDASYLKWLHQPLPRNYAFWVGMEPDRAAQLYAHHANP